MRARILIGGAAVVLAAAVGAAPVVIGAVTQQAFRDARERAVEVSPFIRSWEVNAYDRGYLGASASSTLTIVPPDSDDSVTVVLEHRIVHAPLAGTGIARVHTETRPVEGTARGLATALYGDARSPLTVDVRIGLTGARTIRVHSPATDGMQRLGEGRVDWRGLEANATIDDRHLDYRLSMPGLDLRPNRAGEAAIRIDSVRATGSFEATEFEDVWTGVASGGIARIRIGEDQGATLAVDQLAFSEETRLSDGLFGFAVEASAEQVKGPAYTLSAVGVELTGDRIAPAFLQSLRRAVAQARDRNDGRTAPGDITTGLQSAPWDEIARREPLLRLKSLRARSPGGALSISARAGLHAPRDDGRTVAMRDLMRLAHGQIHARAPERIVIDAIAKSIGMRADGDPDTARRSAIGTLQGLRDQGLITIDNGEIESSASYDRGMIRINGAPLFGGAG